MNPARELTVPSNGISEKPDFASDSLFFVGTATVLLGYTGFTMGYLSHGETYTFNVSPNLWQQV